MDQIKLFVPGRLCLFGEHTDWAGMYRTTNSSLEKGYAIVTGVEQGIYATAEVSRKFIIKSNLDMYNGEGFECEMDSEKLLEVARQGGLFAYVAGVASYINDNYSVEGVTITVTKMDLPVKSGLSSSAAICVLVARAFNQLYKLKMNTQGEMQAAFRGEQRTPSRCGRLDQACAYGVKPVLLEFDGVDISSKELELGGTFSWVIANLMASKDTIKILADLNRCYPFAEDSISKNVQEALGADNIRYIQDAIGYLKSGDAKNLGKTMNQWQYNFDKKVIPASDELIAPVLHSVIKDENIQKWIYGAKGVGSQGDGSVQFLVRNKKCMNELLRYLREEKGMDAFSLTLKPGRTIRKAIIPLAGFGTRVFPATKCIKKCFLPVLDSDGVLKPALMIMLQQLLDAGIEDICLVIGEEDKEEFEEFFAPVPSENYEKLSQDKKELQWQISSMYSHITYVIQKERLGFGHAVWLCRKFAANEPTLLMLGDFLYKSNETRNCCKQVMDAYKEVGKLLISVHGVPLEDVVHYGILCGQWEDKDETMMNVQTMKEKPTSDYAKEYLKSSNKKHKEQYFATFGQYVLTPEVFKELDKMIRSGEPSEGSEYGLTAVLETVRKKSGMYGFVPDGKCYDIGLPEEYRKTMLEYSL